MARRSARWNQLLTVGALRAAIDGVSDEMLVVVPGFDHSYDIQASASVTSAIDEGDQLSEDFGPEHDDPDAGPQKRVSVLLIRG